MPDKFLLQPVPSLPERVAEVLSQEITQGSRAPGSRLPVEAELAARFGVSRAVIREALAKLKYEGLVDSRQGRGVTVVGPAGRRSYRLEDAHRMSPADQAQLYELRAVLETEAAALAARRRRKADLNAMDACLKAMHQAVETEQVGSLPDAEFHCLLAEASGNRHLCDLTRFLYDRLAVLIQSARQTSLLTPGLPRVVQQEHQAIFQAILARDPAGARTAALAHLRNAAQRLGLARP
ncbi:MAG: FadR/GntR family transcriptional regulator [Pseudomonadota bacterium]